MRERPTSPQRRRFGVAWWHREPQCIWLPLAVMLAGQLWVEFTRWWGQ